MKCNNRKISILRIAHARVSYRTAVLPTRTVSAGQLPTTIALNRGSGEPRMENPDWRTQTGEHRLEKPDWRTLTEEHRLEKPDWRTQTGESRLENTDWRIQTGEHRLDNTDWRTKTGEPRLCGAHRNVTYLVSTKERRLESGRSVSVSKFRT